VTKRKICKRCGKKKSTSRFSKQAAAADNLSPWCKDCHKINRQQHYEKNKDQEKQRAREWQAKHPERHKANRKRYYAEHQEEAKVASRMAHAEAKKDPGFAQRQRERVKEWRRRHPEMAKAIFLRSRAKRRGAKVVERVYRKKVYERDHGCCHLCNNPVAFKNMHLDHVIPVSRGGEHSYANVKASHATCNLVKGSKLLSEL